MHVHVVKVCKGVSSMAPCHTHSLKLRPKPGTILYVGQSVLNLPRNTILHTLMLHIAKGTLCGPEKEFTFVNWQWWVSEWSHNKVMAPFCCLYKYCKHTAYSKNKSGSHCGVSDFNTY